jgi:hypothetical protein
MKNCKKQHDRAIGALWLALAAFSMALLSWKAAAEEAFPVLQIGTQSYTNVTVTTKATNYIFILHAGGMQSIRLAELPPEMREKLGYSSGKKTNASTGMAKAWAQAGVAKLETQQIKDIRTKLEQNWHSEKSAGLPLLGLINFKLLLGILGLVLLVYLFHCYCFKLICEKAGHPPGVLVWVPVLHWVPLVRAAGMSGWWAMGMLIPVLNIAALILWSVKIAKARGKSGWVAFFLILPVTSFLAILYLAFSDGGKAEEDTEEPQVMSLQSV